MEKPLENYAQEYLDLHFDINLNIPIEINARLSRSLGRYIMKGGKPLRIEISKRLLAYGEMDEIIGVLQHELIHYALHILGKPFSDGNPYFENTLKRLQAPATESIRLNQPIHHYECNCTIHKRVRALHKNKSYKCSACNSTLKYLGKYAI